jgi:hypothetical protein
MDVRRGNRCCTRLTNALGIYMVCSTYISISSRACQGAVLSKTVGAKDDVVRLVEEWEASPQRVQADGCQE